MQYNYLNVIYDAVSVSKLLIFASAELFGPSQKPILAMAKLF